MNLNEDNILHPQAKGMQDGAEKAQALIIARDYWAALPQMDPVTMMRGAMVLGMRLMKFCPEWAGAVLEECRQPGETDTLGAAYLNACVGKARLMTEIKERAGG